MSDASSEGPRRPVRCNVRQKRAFNDLVFSILVVLVGVGLSTHLACGNASNATRGDASCSDPHGRAVDGVCGADDARDVCDDGSSNPDRGEPPCSGPQNRVVDGVCLCTALTEGCGFDGCGDALPACVGGWEDSQRGHDLAPAWSLCDESSHTCTLAAPVADCNDDWCRIPATTYLAGGPRDVVVESSIWPRHPASITRPFEIQRTEVTQAQWLQVMGLAPSDNPAPPMGQACGSDCPVTGTTFFDMLEFANRLSEAAGLEACYALEGCNDHEPGRGLFLCERARYLGPTCAGYRLPSEFEWALAAGAGANTCWPSGEPEDFVWNAKLDPRLDAIGWYAGNCTVHYSPCSYSSQFVDGAGACCGFHRVAQKKPNPFGLYDTAGNAAEATWSRWRERASWNTRVDPGHDGVMRESYEYVVRGGTWSAAQRGTCTYLAHNVRADLHNKALDLPGDTSHLADRMVGFRLVRTLKR